MAKDPAFLFYPGDYLAGTMHLDFECKGAYVELLMLQFNNEHMTLHMIRHVLSHKFDHIWSHISDKFVEKNGLYWNERLRMEKDKRVNYCKSRKDNKSKDKHMTTHMYQHMENENINENINNINKESFEKFWNLYDKKIGRAACEKKWVKLTEREIELIMAHIPKYKESKPEIEFRKDPIRYLTNKSWNDEIIKSKPNGTIKRLITESPIPQVHTSGGRGDLFAY